MPRAMKRTIIWKVESPSIGTMKNLFGLQHVYLQVLLTRLTPVLKTRLFLKPTNVDKTGLATFHSFNNKENCFHV